MSNNNKSRGFKQTAFNYPGISPLKGKKKDAKKLAAKEKRDAIRAKIEESMDVDIESTDLMSGEGFSIEGAAPPTPFPAKKHSPMKEDKMPSLGLEKLDVPVQEGPNKVHHNFTPSSPKVSKPKLGEKLGNAGSKILNSDIGGAVATSAVNALIGAGINAITKPKKEKKSRRGPDVSGFSRLKFGRS